MPPDELRATGPRSVVLVVGDANSDLVLRGDVVPRFGQAEQLLDDASLVVGGSAAITAHGLARLGRAVALVASVGDDAFGQRLRGQLSQAGVDISRVVVRPDVATGLTVILSRGEDRAMLTHTGAIDSLTVPEVLAAVEDLGDRGVHLHVSSLYLQPGLAHGLSEVLRAARGVGLTTSLDTNDDPNGQWDGVDALLEHLDVLLPNRAEATALGRDPDPRRAAASLAARGPLVVVKDGDQGAFAVTPVGQVVGVPARTPRPPVDTTGAGDTFNAAFLDAWIDGEPLPTAVCRAVAAGTVSVGAIGGTARQPTRDQIDRALRDPAPQSGDGHDQ